MQYDELLSGLVYLDDVVELVFIAVVQQFVGLVHDEHFDLLQVDDVLFLEQVEYSADGGHHHVAAFLLDSLYVVLDFGAADEVAHVQLRQQGLESR